MLLPFFWILFNLVSLRDPNPWVLRYNIINIFLNDVQFAIFILKYPDPQVPRWNQIVIYILKDPYQWVLVRIILQIFWILTSKILTNWSLVRVLLHFFWILFNLLSSFLKILSHGSLGRSLLPFFWILYSVFCIYSICHGYTIGELLHISLSQT